MKGLIISFLLAILAAVVTAPRAYGASGLIGFTSAPLTITISATPCTRDGDCSYGQSWSLPNGDTLLGFYNHDTREIVLPPDYEWGTLLHEWCHDYLYRHDAAMNAFPDSPSPWDLPAVEYPPDQVRGEDAARTCAAYLTQDALDLNREAWAEEWIPLDLMAAR